MKNKDKIINLLVKNQSLYNVNQISRILGISVGSAHKIIKELEKNKIVKSISLGNAIYHRPDFSNRETRQIASLNLMENKKDSLEKNLFAKVYSKEIEKINSKIIVLFGSVLTKKEKADDIDVLFVISEKKQAKDIYKQCIEISKTKTKQIIPFILTQKEFREKIINKEEIILNIIKEGIVLLGEEDLIKILSGVKWQI